MLSRDGMKPIAAYELAAIMVLLTNVGCFQLGSVHVVGGLPAVRNTGGSCIVVNGLIVRV